MANLNFQDPEVKRSFFNFQIFYLRLLVLSTSNLVHIISCIRKFVLNFIWWSWISRWMKSMTSVPRLGHSHALDRAPCTHCAANIFLRWPALSAVHQKWVESIFYWCWITVLYNISTYFLWIVLASVFIQLSNDLQEVRCCADHSVPTLCFAHARDYYLNECGITVVW